MDKLCNQKLYRKIIPIRPPKYKIYPTSLITRCNLYYDKEDEKKKK